MRPVPTVTAGDPLPPADSDPTLRTAEQAAAWLEGLINVEKRPDWPYRRFSLEPIRALLDRLDAPEAELSVLHVAGSKGKGSTALLSESLLRAGGLRVGTFTSPHLESWTERFRIDGEPVSGDRLAAAVDRVRVQVERLRGEAAEQAPTFFDATTATAFLLFREAQIDHAVVEVGLGGRLDSTNACRPRVSCITSIELEHTDRLGHTLGAIAGEKAGILKPGVPAVVGALPEEALAVVERRAAEVGAPLTRLGAGRPGDGLSVQVLSRHVFGSRVRIVDGPLDATLDLPLPGPAAPVNAALAFACVRRLLGPEREPELPELAARAFAGASLPGRIELLERDPVVIVDAAHTPASVHALAQVLEELHRPIDLVLSISGDKDLPALLDALLARARRVTLTRADAARSLEPARIAQLARNVAPELPLRVVPNPHLAVRAAREAVLPGEALCVAGSVYLAGIARKVLRDPTSNRRVAVTRGGAGRGGTGVGG